MSVCDFIKELVPDTVIDKITLSSKGGATGKAYENPHVDLSAAYILPDEDEADLTDAAPPVRIDGYTTSTSTDTDSNLNITVDFSILEKIASGATGTVGSWFSQEEYVKYFKVEVTVWAFPTDTVFTFDMGRVVTFQDMINAGEDFYDDLSHEIMSHYGATDEDDGSEASANYGDEMSRFIDAFREISSTKTLSVSDELNLRARPSETGAPITLSDLYNWGITSQSDTGETIFKLPMSANFDLPGVPPDAKNIIVDVKGQLDMRQLESDYDIDLDGDGMIGGGSTLENDATQGVWAVSGSVVSPSATSVSGQEMDTAIVDMRNYDQVVNIPSLTSDLISIPTGTSAATRENTYFSDVSLSHDEYGGVSGIFHVDYDSIMQDNAQCNTLFLAPNTIGVMLNLDGATFAEASIKALLEESLILELSVYRERVDSNFAYKDPNHKQLVATFQQEVDNNVAYDLQPAVETTKSHSTTTHKVTGAIRERLSYFHADDMSNLNPISYDTVRYRPIRTFEFRDREIMEYTEGEYQYSVKLKIKDGSADQLQYDARTLGDIVLAIEYYYETAKKYYNTNSNTLDAEAFSAELAMGLDEDVYGDTSWAYLLDSSRTAFSTRVAGFLGTLLIVLNAPIDSIATTQASIAALLATNTASLDSILTAKTIIGDIQAQLATVTGASLKGNDSSSAGFYSPSSPTSGDANHVIELHKIFKSTALKMHNKGTGIDFVRPLYTPTKTTSVKLTEATFMPDVSATDERVGSVVERMKANSFVLPPSYIYTTKADEYFTRYDLVPNQYNPTETYRTMGAYTSLYGTSKTGLYGALFEKMTGCESPKSVSSQEPIGEYSTAQGLQFISSQEATKYASCEDITGESTETTTSEFSHTPSASLSAEEVSTIHTLQVDTTSTSTAEALTDVYMRAHMNETGEYPSYAVRLLRSGRNAGDAIGGAWAEEHSASYANAYALYDKGAYLGIIGKDKTPDFGSFLAQTSGATARMLFKLYFGTFTQVQYLHGYEMKTVYDSMGTPVGTRPCLSAPIWRPLNSQVLRSVHSAAASERTTICRLKKLTIPELGIHYPESLCLPIYHEHFTLVTEE